MFNDKPHLIGFTVGVVFVKETQPRPVGLFLGTMLGQKFTNPECGLTIYSYVAGVLVTRDELGFITAIAGHNQGIVSGHAH